MSFPITRRGFVAGALAGLGDFAFLRGLPLLTAADAQVNPNVVQCHPDIEPLVRLIEETPREKLLEVVADRIRGGLTYQPLMAALLLAGVRGIRPRPVGFKFHAVLVVNSAHLATLAAEDRDRWLPLFWALDNYKNSQAANQKEGGWVMPPPAEGKLPPAHQARQRFTEAMDNWDEEAADRAVVSLARGVGANEVIELFWRYGARDFRDIGHKAIFVANSWRAMQTVGWRHAEPVLRSLAYALLEHEGDNPARRDGDPDRPGRENLTRLEKIGPEWQAGKRSPEAAADLLATLRGGSAGEASAKVVDLLAGGVHPDSIWDGVFLGAGELLMRQPGIVGVHCITSANALHFAYQASADPKTRQLALLQAAAFMPLFRQAMQSRGAVGKERLDTLEKAEVPANPEEAVADVFAAASKDRLLAARKALAVLERDAEASRPLMAAARRLVFTKGRDSHDYKFSSAALEDYYHVAPAWRARYLATGLFFFRGSGDRDNELIRRARGALEKG
jgi:hypothetical protein